jgi:hypothetical protein
MAIPSEENVKWNTKNGNDTKMRWTWEISVTEEDLECRRKQNIKMHAYLATLYTRLGRKLKNSEWGEDESWMTDENDYEWQTESRGQKQEKQSRWDVKLGRKRSSEKVSFKFFVKLISFRVLEKVTAGKACWDMEWVELYRRNSFGKVFHKKLKKI